MIRTVCQSVSPGLHIKNDFQHINLISTLNLRQQGLIVSAIQQCLFCLYEMSLFVHQTDGDDKVLGVWTGVKVCQDLHKLAEDLYPGDAGCDDAAPPLGAAAAVQNLCHRPHGHSCTGVPIK